MPRAVVIGPSNPLMTAVVAGLEQQGLMAARSFGEAADVAVHLGPPSSFPDVLEAAAETGCRHVVLRSTGAVYGAWPDNPIPLTEDAAVRPLPGFRFAEEFAEAERWAADADRRQGGPSLAVLRLGPIVTPAPISARSAADSTPTGHAYGHPSVWRAAETAPSVQALHVRDAASAMVHAAVERFGGVFNVAAPGSVAASTAAELWGWWRSPVDPPDRVASVFDRIAVGGAGAPHLAYACVLAADRMRATGWSAVYSNEEAIVATRPGGWFRELSPKRRQEVALASAASLTAGLAGLAAALSSPYWRAGARRARR